MEREKIKRLKGKQLCPRGRSVINEYEDRVMGRLRGTHVLH